MGASRKSAVLTDPVVTAVVTTVQKADMNPPILVSIPGPIWGMVGMNAIARSMMKSRYAPISTGLTPASCRAARRRRR